MTIDYGAAEPLWRQLADILMGKIESGELPAGRIMPSENRLSLFNWTLLWAGGFEPDPPRDVPPVVYPRPA